MRARKRARLVAAQMTLVLKRLWVLTTVGQYILNFLFPFI